MIFLTCRSIAAKGSYTTKRYLRKITVGIPSLSLVSVVWIILSPCTKKAIQNLWKLLCPPTLLFLLDTETKYTPEISGACSRAYHAFRNKIYIVYICCWCCKAFFRGAYTPPAMLRVLGLIQFWELSPLRVTWEWWKPLQCQCLICIF